MATLWVWVCTVVVVWVWVWLCTIVVGVGVEHRAVQWWVWVCYSPITTRQPGCALGLAQTSAGKYNPIFFKRFSFVSLIGTFDLAYKYHNLNSIKLRMF